MQEYLLTSSSGYYRQLPMLSIHSVNPEISCCQVYIQPTQSIIEPKATIRIVIAEGIHLKRIKSKRWETREELCYKSHSQTQDT